MVRGAAPAHAPAALAAGLSRRAGEDRLPHARPRHRGAQHLVTTRSELASRSCRAGARLHRWCRRGMRQTLQGSFSAVPKRNFASEHAFKSSRRDQKSSRVQIAQVPRQKSPYIQYGSHLAAHGRRRHDRRGLAADGDVEHEQESIQGCLVDPKRFRGRQAAQTLKVYID